MRKALSHNEFRFRSDIRNHRLTNVYTIRSKSDVELIESVHEWIREYSEYLARSANKSSHGPGTGANIVINFLEKARRLITQSRKHREPNPGTLGPFKADSKTATKSSGIRIAFGERFSDSDRKIINFLQAWVLTGQFNRMPGLHAACSSLLLATDCYGEDVFSIAESSLTVLMK